MTNTEILSLARDAIARESAAVAHLAGQLDDSFASVADVPVRFTTSSIAGVP